MQLVFVLLTLLLLVVAVFALQNAQPVTVRFVHWELPSNLAAVTLSATAAGAAIAALLGLTAWLSRWRRSRGAAARGPETGSARRAPTGPPAP